MKVQKMVVSVKTYDYYHHKFNFGNFFQLPCKTVKNLKVKFRSKFNRGYLQSAVWKALYNFNPIDDGSFFRGCSWIDGGGGAKKAPLPKIRLTYPTMMTLGTVIPYPKKIQTICKSRDTPLEFWWHQHFFTENQENFAIPRNTDIDWIWTQFLILLTFFEQGFLNEHDCNFDHVSKIG